MSKRVLGVIGGMGPLATADLYRKIAEHTAARCDQDHPRTVIDSNTDIPDRTEALLRGGADPVPELVKSARRLVAAGAEVLLIPCNTAHCFYDDVAAAVDAPVLNMLTLTRDALRARGVTRAGLLATDGTVQSGVYQRAFAGSGVELLTPDEAGQAEVTALVYRGVKAGDPSYDAAPFCRVCEELLARGAQTLILGCTELPCAFEQYRLDYPAVDPTLELALAAIRAAGCETR